jgi:hypothetical protein
MTEEKKPGPEDEDELVELISVQGEMDAELLVGILEGEGIDVMLKSNQTFSALPFTVDGMGEVRLLVREGDLLKAREVIQAYVSGTEEIAAALRKALEDWAPPEGSAS